MCSTAMVRDVTEDRGVFWVMALPQLPAALYAPLRVVLFEDEQGRGIFEFDKPSSFFGQYGDERVAAVGRYLDAALEAVLGNAAEQQQAGAKVGSDRVVSPLTG